MAFCNVRQRRRNFSADVSAFAHSRYDNAPFRIKKNVNGIHERLRFHSRLTVPKAAT